MAIRQHESHQQEQHQPDGLELEARQPGAAVDHLAQHAGRDHRAEGKYEQRVGTGIQPDEGQPAATAGGGA